MKETGILEKQLGTGTIPSLRKLGNFVERKEVRETVGVEELVVVLETWAVVVVDVGVGVVVGVDVAKAVVFVLGVV